MAYGDDEDESESPKEREESDRWFMENRAREHRKHLLPIQEDVLKKIEGYRNKKIDAREFYSGMIAETMRLGSCQKEYNKFSFDSGEHNGLAKEIEEIVLGGMLNGRGKSS